MSRESFRQAVVTQVESRKLQWSGFPLVVEYDNKIIVDTQTQAKPFLCVRIVYVSGEQANLGPDSRQRDYGQIHIAAAAKENSGTAEANTLLDFFVPALRMRTLAGFRLYGSRPQKELEHKGWLYYPVLIPFDGDSSGVV
jgi:hypothetical protein